MTMNQQELIDLADAMLVNATCALGHGISEEHIAEAQAAAAIAQAAAQTRLADNSDRIAKALERIVAALHSKDGMNVADNLDSIARSLG